MIVVYSKNNCPACERAKALLTSKGVEFTIKNIDKDLEAMDYIVARKFKAMPVVLEDGQPVDLTQI